MPVYRGVDFVEETLRSILAQTYQDFHLVMSVDGPDDPTFEICRKYTDDPRVDAVVQDPRLGWPGNLNWLIRSCDREFFCYWQQDDLASTGYLEALLEELTRRPDAAIAYTDVQWFGKAFHREGTPSIEGNALSRVMQNIEAIRFEPFRGLMRASMLPEGPEPIPVTPYESHQEEFVFLTKMAAAGSFIRCPDAMYFKRLHGENAFVRWQGFPDWQRRRGWVSMGAGMYEIARNLAPPGLRPRVLGQLLDRLAVRRHGRGHFYDPPQSPLEFQRLVRDFVAYADVGPEDLGDAQAEPPPLERPVHQEIVRAIQFERKTAGERFELRDHLATNHELTVDVGDERLMALLGYGWSNPESWGVWSDGEHATIRIPAPAGTAWEAILHGHPYAPRGPVRVGIGAESGSLDYTEVQPGEPLSLTARARGQSRPLVQLHLPAARSPVADGLSQDSRVLGFGLTHLGFSLLDKPTL